MMRFVHKLLYRLLPLEGYLRVVSALFFLWKRLGIGRYDEATEYVYHLPKLVGEGATAIDIGANLGYYSRYISQAIGESGRLYSVEPVAPILGVLRHNLRRCSNVEILPYALGEEEREIVMCNDTARYQGYFGTGQNFVGDAAAAEGEGERFPAQMRRGSELFAKLTRLNFIKCDIEGYEVVVMNELRPLLERFRPTVLIETGGENRPQIIALFRSLGYRGFTLEHGLEVPLSDDSEKDIIFRAQ